MSGSRGLPWPWNVMPPLARRVALVGIAPVILAAHVYWHLVDAVRDTAREVLVGWADFGGD